MKSTVNKDFFTNVAVAWFSAGVIAPFLFPTSDNNRLFTISISVIMTLGFLSIARFYEFKNI